MSFADAETKTELAPSRQIFTSIEDNKLKELVKEYGDKNWRKVAAAMGNRTARQCRERYRNYLSPGMINGPWSQEEDLLLYLKFRELGPKWSKIAKFFQNRSDVNVKNRWTSIKNHYTFVSLEFIKSQILLMKKKEQTQQTPKQLDSFSSTLDISSDFLPPQMNSDFDLPMPSDMTSLDLSFNNDPSGLLLSTLFI